MKKNIKHILLAICSGFCFFINIDLFKNLNNFSYRNFLGINTLGMFLVAIVVFCLLNKIKNYKTTKSKYIVCILLSLCMVIGEPLETNGTFTIIYSNIVTLLISVLKLLGYVAIFKIGFYYLDILVGKFKNKDFKVKNKHFKWYLEMLEKYPFKTSLISILIAWIIYLIAFYPIVMSPDPSYQIIQYFNIPNKYIDWVVQTNPNVYMTTHHSVLHTYLLGWSISLGRKLLNDNFGLFLYTILQTLIYSSTLAYTIKFAKNNKASNKCCFVLLFLYMSVPMFGLYTMSANKDILYTSFMILFILFVFDYIKNYKNKRISISFMIKLFIILIFLCLFRNNGLYIAIMTLPFLLIFSKKNWYRIGITFVAAFFCIFSFNSKLIPALGISKGSIREMLSIPFQQTARLATYYDKDITSQDKKAIDKILNYDTLKDRYNPKLADPVKNEYNKYTESEDLKRYFAAWARGLVKHPDVYIDATLNNTYGYFYPNTHNWYVYGNFKDTITKDGLVDYSWNKNTEWLRSFLYGWANVFPYIPIVGSISNIALGFWVMLIISSYVITNNHKKYLITLIPMYGSWIFCILSPANTYFRYAMPYLFVLPVMIVLMLTAYKKNND